MASNEYWNEELETMSRPELEKLKVYLFIFNISFTSRTIA